MLKIFFRIILVLFILICTGIGGVYFYAGNIVKKAVETFVPEITQTSAHLNKMNLSLMKGEILLSGLALGNPQGFHTPESFSVKTILVRFQPESLFQEKIIIHQILIDGTHITAEATYQNGRITSNLTEIQKNVDSYIQKNITSKKTASQEKKVEPVPEQKSKEVVIKDLQINNTTLTAGLMTQSIDIPLPSIQKKNIGQQPGSKTTWQDTIAYILNMISDESVKESTKALKQMIQQNAAAIINSASGTVNAATEKAGNLINSVKGIF